MARLTAEIESRLRAAAPDYATDEEAGTLAFAADVLLREPGSSPISFARRQHVAARLGRAETTDRQTMVGAAARYRRRLDQHEVSDHEVMLTQGGANCGAGLRRLLVLLIVLAPFALAGVVMNILPLAGLLAAMRRSVDSDDRGDGANCRGGRHVSPDVARVGGAGMERLGLASGTRCVDRRSRSTAPLQSSPSTAPVESWRDWTGRRRALHLGRALRRTRRTKGPRSSPRSVRSWRDGTVVVRHRAAHGRPAVALLVWAVADLIRRTDTTVARKALWLVPVVVVPLVGPVVYLIFRPRRAQDIRGFGGRRQR